MLARGTAKIARTAHASGDGERPSAGADVANSRAALAMFLASAFAVTMPAPNAAQTSAASVTVFAAASLADALGEAARVFETRTGHEVVLSFAGSAALARQIMLGAPADLFISADPAWADALEADGLVENGRRHDLLENRLVLIAAGSEGPAVRPPDALDFDALLGDGRLAIGLVEAVPAGRYGMAALQSLGQWPSVQDRLAETDNVRAALALVAIGAAPLGVVYETDARADPRVHIRARFTPDMHPPIVYPIVDLANADHEAENDFYDFLRSDAGGAIFAAHGFGILPAEAPQ